VGRRSPWATPSNVTGIDRGPETTVIAYEGCAIHITAEGKVLARSGKDNERAPDIEPLTVGEFDIAIGGITKSQVGATPLQSLTMLNDEFILENTVYLAERVNAIVEKGNAARKIEIAYLLTLSRKPRGCAKITLHF